MTSSQHRWYFKEWSLVRAKLRAAGLSPAEADARRHQIHLEELGQDKSHLHFTEDDFDAVLAGFWKISRPSDLAAQLRQLNMRRQRLITGIDQLGFPPAYVQAVIDTMDRHGRLEIGPMTKEEVADRPDDWAWQEELVRGDRPRRRLEDLHPHELKKIIVALKEHARRIEKAAIARSVLLHIAKMTGFLLPLRSHKSDAGLAVTDSTALARNYEHREVVHSSPSSTLNPLSSFPF